MVSEYELANIILCRNYTVRSWKTCSNNIFAKNAVKVCVVIWHDMNKHQRARWIAKWTFELTKFAW